MCFISCIMPIIAGEYRNCNNNNCHFQRTQKFFGTTQREPLSRRGSWEILKCRDIVIIFSDILTLSGSIMKYKLDTQVYNY